LDRLTGGAGQLGLDLSEEGISRLLCHYRLLDRWADRVNLTTIRDPGQMAELLYLDSAMLGKHIQADARLHDVGTGAGFPGLVLKALHPDLHVTLTEARRKKVTFLKQAARDMGLTQGLQIHHRRLGWDGTDDGELWPEVVSRAAFPPPEWIRLGAPLVALGGRLWICSGTPHPEVADEGDDCLEEMKDWPPDGFSLGSVHSYRLPKTGRRRRLVTLLKDG
jgi:16S rRNA (guanine527-N7)-methyltransferase